MLFDGPPSELPIAMLRPSVLRPRTLVGDLAAWSTDRRAWLRPRAVPLLAAFIGLFATLGAVKAIGRWSHREPLQLAVHATRLDREPDRTVTEPGERAPVRIVIRPLTPGGRYLELTIGTPDPR